MRKSIYLLSIVDCCGTYFKDMKSLFL